MVTQMIMHILGDSLEGGSIDKILFLDAGEISHCLGYGNTGVHQLLVPVNNLAIKHLNDAYLNHPVPL